LTSFSLRQNVTRPGVAAKLTVVALDFGTQERSSRIPEVEKEGGLETQQHQENGEGAAGQLARPLRESGERDVEEQ
jgi:hypothetical protein